MTAGVAGFIGVKCSRPSVAYTQEHQHTHTHKQMHREKKERQKTGCKQQDQNKTEMAGRRWLEDCDRYSPQPHTYTSRSGDFADVLGIFFFYFYFCHKRKKERKDFTPHTVYTFYWQDVKRKEVTESNRCLVMSSIQAPSYGKLDVSLSLGIFQMQLITNKQYLTNVALRGVQFGSLGSLPVCYSSYHGCLPHSHLLPHLQKLHAV